MASELDRRMDAVMAALTGDGGQLPLGRVERFGRTLPMIAAAPPTLPAYFAHFCQQHRDVEFLVAGDERLRFGSVHDLATRAARALVTGYGVRRGDRVAIAARNSPSWIVLYMAIIMAGGVATLLNGWWQAEEMAAALDEVEVALVFADAPRARRLAAIPGGAAVRVEIFDDLQPIETALAEVLAHAEDDLGNGAGAVLPALTGDDHATILFTSGSTGRSKGALSTHRQVLQGTFNFLASALMMMGIAAQDGALTGLQPATLLNLPLFHVTAMVPTLLQSFAMGRKLVLMPKWDAEEAMRLIEREKVTYFVGVPLMSYEMVNHPERARYDLSTVTDFAAGGAPRPVEHVRRLDAELTGAPLIGYGLTETNAIGTGNWRSNYIAKPDSAGRASAPLVELAILADDGTALPLRATGEIGIRSAANFQEYWGRPDDTAAAFTADGFFRTGDLGYLDEDGYLFIVDRKKDIIIRGGENISCQEVEAALYAHPLVAEAAVFGLADARYGEVPGAVVHLSEPGGVTCEDLLAFLAQHVAAFKVPARLWIEDAPLPRLGTEKIDKITLRRRYRAVAETEAAAAA
ncbi:class I adenylate-forming enzyme family protein [Sphingomonas sp. BK069]|uniref:class I adenylate-forming enzyme family protein n=1 Tax=Sphingomonas sp. BK069 TaxID=2586979 RepID=UPI001621385B|nr:class I adenylate-forming enzyme family protein [Sphingomonas sp. BK069]MBB3347373.1 acyl-CoA synthetase (AMP-forming)/AMP-acid ligase II [Sphingomonas sp. BK069]